MNYLQLIYVRKHLFLSRFIITRTTVQVHLDGNLKIHVSALMIVDGFKHSRLIYLCLILNFY